MTEETVKKFITVHGNLNPGSPILLDPEEIVGVMSNPSGTGTIITMREGSLLVVETEEEVAALLGQEER